MSKYFVAIISIALLFLFFSITVFEAVITTRHNSSAAKSKHRGVSFVAGRQVAEDDFVKLVENHVDWISQTPSAGSRITTRRASRWPAMAACSWGERDEGLELTTQMAGKHGIKTLLKPHIGLRHRSDG